MPRLISFCCSGAFALKDIKIEDIPVVCMTEVHPGTSQPSSYLPTGYLLGQDRSTRLPGGQALGWTSEGSSEDQDHGVDMYSGYLGI